MEAPVETTRAGPSANHPFGEASDPKAAQPFPPVHRFIQAGEGLFPLGARVQSEPRFQLSAGDQASA
jgi:hypothetical protein